MAPGRTSCLVCSSHGGMKQLIERRNVIRTEATVPTDNRSPSPRPRQAPFSTPENGHRYCPIDEIWDPNGRCFSMARSAVAGVMVAELVKVLKPRCHREELRNWRLTVNGGGNRRKEDGSRYGRGGGYLDEERKENPSRQLQDTTHVRQLSPIDQKNYMATIRPVVTTPDPPSMVLSTSFDPFSGDSLRAIPAGFTEWGVEEIRPSLLAPRDDPRRGKVDIDNPFSLRVLVRTIFARFGVDAKAVAAAAPGSECRVRARGGYDEWGEACERKFLWAEWEKVDATNAGQDEERSLFSKVWKRKKANGNSTV